MKADASAIFAAGIKAVNPESCVGRWLRFSDGVLQVGREAFKLDQIEKLYVVGAGKASAAMAKAVEDALGDRIADGLVVTKYGHGVPLNRCRLMESGHPVPDENGARAARALLDLVACAGPRDLILCLVSGGGSALIPAPAQGIGLSDKQATTRQLLACGATIHEINAIRKHLSRIKGGRLCLAANGARIVSLIISDVVGDDLDIIASGMTAPDSSTFAGCMDILSRYALTDKVPEPVRNLLTMGAKGVIRETPKPGDRVFENVRNQIVGCLSDALSAAEQEALRLGYRPMILTSQLTGEASQVAKVLCAVAGEIRKSGRPIEPPACLLSGGETTVILKGQGLGGRNMELALAAGIELAGADKILLLSAGTDGTDGPTDAAGAFADGATVARAEAMGISAVNHLANNNAYHFFRPLDDLLITGPTRTNVMDLQILLVRG